MNLGTVPDPFMRMMEQDANPRPSDPSPVVTDRLVERAIKGQPQDVREGVLRQLSDLNAICRTLRAMVPGQHTIGDIERLLQVAVSIVTGISVQCHGALFSGWVWKHRIWCFEQAERLLPKDRSSFTHRPGSQESW